MSNIDAIKQTPDGMNPVPRASRLIGEKPSPWFNVLAAVVVVAGIIYSGIHLANDLSVVRDTRVYPYVLLGIALLIALGFEFVNGFHDTANAVATVIYTNSLSPNLAVVWSGFCNFSGVLVSTGAVAFGIVSLLPVELILQVGSGAGFAMVFALLISPLIGFSAAYLLLTILKATVRIPALYKEPEGNKPPPLWIRGLLILTCTGVSFFHGGNDGQKGMGLIMLILIGTVPTAYALNRTMHEGEVSKYVAVSTQARSVLSHYSLGAAAPDD